jgi:hypothetical protein
MIELAAIHGTLKSIYVLDVAKVETPLLQQLQSR